MKTKQDIMSAGFKFVAVNENKTEVWAKFTGYLDCIQYIYCDDKQVYGDIQVTTFGQLCLMKHMLQEMNDEYFKDNIDSVPIDEKVLWKNRHNDYM